MGDKAYKRQDRKPEGKWGISSVDERAIGGASLAVNTTFDKVTLDAYTFMYSIVHDFMTIYPPINYSDNLLI
jgi:hypothetical protein